MSPTPPELMQLAQALYQLEPIGMGKARGRGAAVARTALPAVAHLFSHAAASQSKAELLHAVSVPLTKHAKVLRAATADKCTLASIEAALGAAALDDATYAHGRGVVHLATAQCNLRRYCAPFWQRLARRSL